MKVEMYYDNVNGRYTNDKECIPVYEGTEGGIFIETWWVDKEENTCIDFAFTGGYNNPYLCRERRNHFDMYNVDPRFLKSLTLPPNFYRQMKERFISEEEVKE